MPLERASSSKGVENSGPGTAQATVGLGTAPMVRTHGTRASCSLAKAAGWHSKAEAGVRADLELGPEEKKSKPKTEPEAAVPSERMHESAPKARTSGKRAVGQ